MMKKLIITILALATVAPVPAYPQQPTSVSIVRLIANPKAYDGKYVRVVGFVSLRFEGTAVYLHQDDYKNFITENALWLKIDKGEMQLYEDGDQKYVLIEGRFDAKKLGHRGGYSGTIKNIKRFQPRDKLTTRE